MPHFPTEIYEEKHISFMKYIDQSIQLIDNLWWRMHEYSFELLDVRIFDYGCYHDWDYALQKRVL